MVGFFTLGYPMDLSISKIVCKFHNCFKEWSHNVDTRGIVYSETTSDFYHYSTICYLTISRILERLALTSDDVFVDIGCGKGRVICCAACYHLKGIIGIEMDTELCKIAEHNINRMRGRKSEVTFFKGFAEHFDYEEGTVFYFFNPFGAATLGNCIGKLHESVKNKPRQVKIVYVNPVYEDVLKECDWLKIYDRWTVGTMFGLSNDVSFWKSYK